MKTSIINKLCIIILFPVICFTSHAQSNMSVVDAWSHYSNSLKSCSPGLYSLPNPLTETLINSIKNKFNIKQQQIGVTNRIVGWQMKKCIVVQTTFKTVDLSPDTIILCAYTKNDLSV